MKRYGITKPKSLDFLLAIDFVIVALCTVWLSIWITITKNFFAVKEVLNNFIDVIKLNIYSETSVLVSLQCLVLYGGFAFAFILCLMMICKNNYKVIAGVLTVLLSAVALTFGIGFVYVLFINQVLKIAVIGLVFMMLVVIALTYRSNKLLVRYVFNGIKLYDLYNKELGNEIKLKKDEKKQKVEIGPSQFDEVFEQSNNREQEEFYFENSNSYGNYGYKNDFEDYNAKIDELMNNDDETKEDGYEVEEVDNIKIIIEDDRIHKGDIDKLKQKQNNDFTFEQKLERSFQVAKDYFEELKAYAEELGFKSALTKQAETFSYKNVKYAMIDVAGQKGLKVYYKLDLADYDGSPIPLKDMSKVKKYQHTPVLLVVKSELALKRAKKLLDDLKVKYGVEKDVEEEIIVEPKKVEKPASKEKVEEKPEVLKKNDDLFSRESNNFTFEQKLEKTNPEVKKYFIELKAYFESLGFKSMLTKQGETFANKNIKYAMITVAGKKSLKIYYKLNIKDYEDSPIPVKFVGDVKKYEKTPVLLVAKSDLAIKRAKKLMDDVKSQLDKE